MTLVELLKYIDDNINTQSGGDKITGAEHNAVLKNTVTALVDIMGTGYGGPIAPADNPGAQTKPIFFMAEEKGTYTYCGGVVVATNLAFISWDGNTWSVKDIGIPDVEPGAENPSKGYGLAKAGDAAPSGRSIGDWYIFIGGGQLVWPGGVKDAPGIVFADRVENVGGTDTVMWELIPFGGDRHLKGVATPTTDIGNLTFVKDDYYLVVQAGDYSQFAPITANKVTSAGIIKYDGNYWKYTANSESALGGSGNYIPITEDDDNLDLLSGQNYLFSSSRGAYVLYAPAPKKEGMRFQAFFDNVVENIEFAGIDCLIEGQNNFIVGASFNKKRFEFVYVASEDQWRVKQLDAEGGGSAGLPSTWEPNKVAIRAITDYQQDIDVGDYETGAIYEFDSTLTAADDNDTYLTPGDIVEPAPGRWIKRKVFSVSGHTHVLSTITPDAGNANKIPVVSPDGLLIGYTAFTFDQIVQLAQVDMSDVNVGEKKILLAEKLADGSPSFTGAIAQLDKLGPPSLDALLDETNAAWDGDEITLTGDNRNGALGENSQEYRIGSDFFLCISHSYGTDATNGSATWVRNRGQDSLTPGITHDDAIIGELETETGWSGADFKQIISKSKKGSWYKAAAGGYLYLCIDKNNGWQRHGVPPTADIEISTASHPTLTTNLAAHDFATNGMYDESSDGTNEAATQAQEWWDTANNAWYKRNMNGYWAKVN